MSIPLKHWYRLGKKTFWLFLLRSSKLFIILFGISIWFTYNAIWGKMSESFKQFFITHSNWYLTGSFVLQMIWLILLGFLIVVVLRGWVLYRQYKFMLDEHAFYVRRGIFFIKEIVIPYHHIQNVEIKQPYLYRFIGLAELDITTLGNGGLMSNNKKEKNLLPIIDHRIAKALAHELVHRGSSKSEVFVVDDEDELNQLTEIK